MREARIWDDKTRPGHLHPNAKTLQEFHDACERLGVTVDDPIVIDFIEPEQERLYHELADINTSHQRRFAIGQHLADIGDIRKGIGLLENALPDIAWLLVESSSKPIKIKTYENEIGPVTIPNFFIAQYLTTYVQF